MAGEAVRPVAHVEVLLGWLLSYVEKEWVHRGVVDHHGVSGIGEQLVSCKIVVSWINGPTRKVGQVRKVIRREDPVEILSHGQHVIVVAQGEVTNVIWNIG